MPTSGIAGACVDGCLAAAAGGCHTSTVGYSAQPIRTAGQGARNPQDGVGFDGIGGNSEPDLPAASVHVLPEQVATLVVDKAQGNPFFSEEIAYALRDTEQIQVVDGECVLNPGLGDLHSLDFPDTVEGVITSRIDRLPPQGQLALKVASVIGRIFASNIFSDVCPIEEDRHLLR